MSHVYMKVIYLYLYLYMTYRQTKKGVCVSEEYISLSLCSTNNTLGLIPAIQKARFKKEIKIYVRNLAYDKKIFCIFFLLQCSPKLTSDLWDQESTCLRQ